MKAVVAAFNQEKALVEAFSLIVQLLRLIDLRYYYIYSCLYPHLARVLVGEAGWPDVAGEGDPPGQLHYRDVVVQRVGVPARVLDRPADSG